MNISALHHYYQDKPGEKYNSIDLLAASLLYIIGQYFSNMSNYFVLTLCCRNDLTCNFYKDMLRKMFNEWQEWPLQIIVLHENEYKKEQVVHAYNILFTDSYESFLEIAIHTNAANYNQNEYYFIHLHTNDLKLQHDMQKILEYCWQHDLINCVIQVQKENGQVLIYTYFPFTEKFCGQVETVLVNEFNGTSLTHEGLFPKKLKNFYGCPLRVVLQHVPPYIFLSTDSNNVTYVAGGFEGKFLLVLSKKLNFSMDIIVPPSETNHVSSVNTLKMLQEHKGDITLGATRQTVEHVQLLTPTMYYYQSTWIVVALSEVYSLTSLEILIFPFTKNTWYLLTVISTLVMSIVTLLRLKLRKHLRKHLDYVNLDFLAITVGLPGYSEPIYNTTRILKVTLIIFSLILRTIYGALLFYLTRFHILRNMPQNLRELLNQNYTLIANQQTYEGLHDIAGFGTINFIVMNTTDHEMPLVYLEKVPIYQAKLMAVALPSVWSELYINEQHTKQTNWKTNRTFELKQLNPAFILILVGSLISTLVFIIELLYQRVKRLKCIPQFQKH